MSKRRSAVAGIWTGADPGETLGAYSEQRDPDRSNAGTEVLRLSRSVA